MKKIKSLEYVRGRIQNAHPRTQKAQINTVVGLAVKGASILISLMLVPLTIDYLSKETYGTWLTISSIVTMLSLMDIGIGNGLRNKFSEAVTRQDTALARAYVSTSYFIFGIIQTCFLLLFVAIFRFIPWQRIFNTDIDISQLQLVVLLTVMAMSVKMVLDIVLYVLFALQESGKVALINLLSNLLILVGIYALTRFTEGNLVYIAAITVGIPVLITLISGFVFYKNQLIAYRPSLQLADFKHGRSLLSLGYKFFFIQVSGIILFSTDNLIITQLFGPAEVTTYNVAFRYFNSMNTLFAITTVPYWSAFTEAFVKNDTVWMIKTFRYMKKLWVGLFIVIIVMVLMADSVYSLWIGKRIIVPENLNIMMGLNAITICWNNATTVVTNGLGRMKLQLLCAIFAASMNIPLGIYFGKVLNLGSAGVILGSCASLWIASIIGGVQANKLVNGTAKGVWDK